MISHFSYPQHNSCEIKPKKFYHPTYILYFESPHSLNFSLCRGKMAQILIMVLRLNLGLSWAAMVKNVA